MANLLPASEPSHGSSSTYGAVARLLFHAPEEGEGGEAAGAAVPAAGSAATLSSCIRCRRRIMMPLMSRKDVAKSVTKVAIREARAQDLRTEILNSDKLKSHFDSNPRDLDILKHDKVLSKKPPPPHLREVPDYLQDSVTKEASKIIQLSKAAMDIKSLRRRSKSQKGRIRSKDPLKTFNSEGKKPSKFRMKRRGSGNEAGSIRKRKKAKHET